MPTQSRQLAAIMFTDIVGYTALMGRDSNKALELVRISKEIQKPLVEKHMAVTKAIKNRRFSSVIKVCSPFELHSKLKNCASQLPTFHSQTGYHQLI